MTGVQTCALPILIRATMDALKKESSPRNVAQRRGKKVSDILPKTDAAPVVEETTEAAEA